MGRESSIICKHLLCLFCIEKKPGEWRQFQLRYESKYITLGWTCRSNGKYNKFVPKFQMKTTKYIINKLQKNEENILKRDHENSFDSLI